MATDGELKANKTILGMRCQYFHSMFSDNNFMEIMSGTVNMPCSKAVLLKVIIYLYSGRMDFRDLAPEQLLELMELLG